MCLGVCKDMDSRCIWVVGSSIVKKAFLHARKTYDGPNLGISRYGFNVLWQGKGGMKWCQLFPHIKLIARSNFPPRIIIIHCGGNSIGQTTLRKLRDEIKSTLYDIKEMFPDTLLVWSQILPRSRWWYSDNNKAMNISAQRLNNFGASICSDLGGTYIKYPELSWNSWGMFDTDRVHLTDTGNDFFIYRIQQTLFDLIGR